MNDQHHHNETVTAPKSIVKERLDFVVKVILQFSFPELDSDAILWRTSEGLRQVALMEDQKITIGRASGSDIMLTDDFTSRTHATIEKKDGEWVIFDCGSRNGTWVNHHPVDAACLRYGDILRVGMTDFVIMEATTRDYVHASTPVQDYR